jgi:hypothetical protein
LWSSDQTGRASMRLRRAQPHPSVLILPPKTKDFLDSIIV